ncbi:SEC-C metal-binding domain-containing protein [Eubacterium aggregans]|uniref:SEC-C metal-binding domain-containing protein n=1 Tax=Eubacterium aggregans TaxID=81409 RepID=UPI003F314B15
MSLFEQWKQEIEAHSEDQQDQEAFSKAFCQKEQGIYEDLLGKKEDAITGTVAGFAEQYGMTEAEIMGFLDGISTSLSTEAPVLDDMTSESAFSFTIDFEKLFWNMLAVPAEWLFTLPQWDGILSQEKRDEIFKDFRKCNIVVNDGPKVGRNDPCPCGSEKKYKKCCGR